MDQIRPNVSLGQQPNANVPPVGDTAPTFGNLMASRQPAPQFQPQLPPETSLGSLMNRQQVNTDTSSGTPADQAIDNQGKDVDSIIAEMGSKQPKEDTAALDKTHLDEIDKILGGKEKINVDENAPAAEGVVDKVKYLGAAMRERLGRDPQERLNAVQSMYGDENARVYKGEIYFRPGKGKNFRKFDQNVFGPVLDWALKNSLNLTPTMANAAVSGAGTAASVATLNPAAAVVGAGASLAAGGAADELLRQGMISTIDQFASKKQNDDRISLKNEVLWNSGINLAAGAAIGAAAKTPPGKFIADKVRGFLGLLTPVEKIESGASSDVLDLSKARSAINEWIDTIHPKMFVEEGKSAAQKAATRGIETGLNVANAMDLESIKLGKAVGNVDSVVQGIAKNKAMQPSVDNLQKKMQETLGKYGYTFDKNGYAVDPVTQGSKAFAFSNPNGGSILDMLANKNNELVSSQWSKGGREVGGGNGYVPMNILNDAIDTFSKLSQYGKKEVGTDIDAFRSLRNAANTDRYAFYDKVLEGSGLPEEQIWKQSYKDYSSKVDEIADFTSMFKNRTERERLVQTLSSQSAKDKLEMVDKIKGVLGESSDAFRSLRGEIIHNFFSENATKNNGVLDTKSAMTWLNSSKNGLISKIMNQEEADSLRTFVMQASHFATDGVLPASQKNTFEKGLTHMTHLVTDPGRLAMDVFSMFGGNKKAIDYMVDHAFLDAVQKDIGKEQVTNMLKSRQYIMGIRDAAKIVDVPTTLESGRKMFVKKYLVPGGAVALNKMAPNMAQTPQSVEPGSQISQSEVDQSIGAQQQIPQPEQQPAAQ